MPVPSSVDTNDPADHLERVGRVGEEWEQRRVPPPDQIAALDGLDADRFGELSLVRPEARFGQDVTNAIFFHHGVVDVGADGQGEIARQCPRGRRPCEHPFAGLELELHRQRRVLSIAIHVVHTRSRCCSAGSRSASSTPEP